LTRFLPSDNNNGIVVDTKTGTVYVQVTNGIVEVDGATNGIIRELNVTIGAGTLALDPTSQTVYGASGSKILGFNVTTGAVVANVSIGYSANSLVADPYTHMVFAAGCNVSGLVCNSMASVVNGTSKTLVSTIDLGNGGYPRIAMDTRRNVVYVSGVAQLVALSGIDGRVLYNANSQVCGPMDSMAVSSSQGEVLAISLDYDYLFVYAYGVLINMYSLSGISGSPQYVAFNPNALPISKHERGVRQPLRRTLRFQQHCQLRPCEW
jgi:hypothetical protein